MEHNAYWSALQQWAAIGLISFNHAAPGVSLRPVVEAACSSLHFMLYVLPVSTTTGNDTTIEGTAENLTSIIVENIQPLSTQTRPTRRTTTMVSTLACGTIGQDTCSSSRK
ncbi:hypothetical protein SCLCIDRAFT_1215818 [Scleroderma citrinum Foug A]|uniref:Uncharacterized protein n=1 Tax=Scleroderma citrinum Foug A TaxID=1036808 RepID=A0A0C3DM38_9AGAM|nr:hypothetical protein SCLCIDRAFT_1215818 [Scleroderma citrinum Foug A]